jgi:putative FmdB family regulatory protein
MPIYEYRCENGDVFEAMQSFSDEPLTDCEVCGAPVKRVMYAPAVHYKGGGFYSTDYKKKGSGSRDDSGAEKQASSDGSPTPASDTPGATKTEKTETPSTKAD